MSAEMSPEDERIDEMHRAYETRQQQAHPWGVGMPAYLQLHEFGRLVKEAFGRYPVLVGSALRKRDPRDVDVRLILPQSEYLMLIGPDHECGKPLTRWAALCRAFSAVGREMTGLPVDFQIQTAARANVYAGSLWRDLGTNVEPPVQLASRPSLTPQVAPSVQRVPGPPKPPKPSRPKEYS